MAMSSPEYGISLGFPLGTSRNWAADQGEPSNYAPYVNLGPLGTRDFTQEYSYGSAESNVKTVPWPFGAPIRLTQ